MRSFRLIVLGVIHLHPRGAMALDRRLKTIRPNALTVEISPWSIQWRQRLGRRLQARLYRSIQFVNDQAERYPDGSSFVAQFIRTHPQLRWVQLQLQEPYEWRIAKRYHTRFHVPMVAVEEGADVRKKFVSIRRLITPDNIRFLLEKNISESRFYDEFHHEENRASRYLAKVKMDEEMHRKTNRADFDLREINLCRNVEKSVNRFQSCRETGTFVHICGWRHFESLKLKLTPLLPFTDIHLELLRYTIK